MRGIERHVFTTLITEKMSHLNEHKLRHKFLDTINPMCGCGSNPETTAELLLRCQHHVISRSKLLNVYTF